MKKKDGADLEGLLPKSYCERRKLYCKRVCIAENKVVRLYCKMGVVGLELYCNIVYCIAGEAWEGWSCIAIH